MIALELKQALRRGEGRLGTFVKLSSASAIEALGAAGLDFAILDTEHAPCDQLMLEHLIRAADCVGLPTIVRVSRASEEHILKALDLGASGVQLPGLESADQVREALRFTKYAPMAAGACPSPSAPPGTARWTSTSTWRAPTRASST